MSKEHVLAMSGYEWLCPYCYHHNFTINLDYHGNKKVCGYCDKLSIVAPASNSPKENVEPPDSGKERQPCGENNNERAVICSRTICDYCTFDGFDDDECGECQGEAGNFNGRKLTPVS